MKALSRAGGKSAAFNLSRRHGRLDVFGVRPLPLLAMARAYLSGLRSVEYRRSPMAHG
jgi:hypothetical protein